MSARWGLQQGAGWCGGSAWEVFVVCLGVCTEAGVGSAVVCRDGEGMCTAVCGVALACSASWLGSTCVGQQHSKLQNAGRS